MPNTFTRSLSCLLGAAVLFGATAASAHITIFPKQSPLGAREKYVMRTPNEKTVPTIRIDGEFPPEAKITSFEDKPGWTVEAKRNAAGAIVGATWKGNLPADGFTEFGIMAKNPDQGSTLTWKFIQYYEDGSKVEWSGPKGSKTPAPIVTLTPAAPQ